MLVKEIRIFGILIVKVLEYDQTPKKKVLDGAPSLAIAKPVKKKIEERDPMKRIAWSPEAITKSTLNNLEA